MDRDSQAEGSLLPKERLKPLPIILLFASIIVWAPRIIIFLALVVIASICIFELSYLRNRMPSSNLWISWDVELIFVLSFIISPIFIEEKLGRGIVFLLFGIVFAGDTGALIGGKLIGKLKLAPKISPNKTVEGALIGLACAFFVGVLIKIIIDIKIPWNSFIVLIVLLNIVGVIGDLNESWLKRVAKQKDASKILGAHGGVIDRIDGVMPVFLTVSLLLFFNSSLVS